MSDSHPEIIFIKRGSPHEEEHHGGAWKIAFADFMTAMMAFFLVLWIINATDKNTKTIIARYFNPVRLEDPAKSIKGIHGAQQTTKAGADYAGDTVGAAVETPGEGNAGSAGAPGSPEGKGDTRQPVTSKADAGRPSNPAEPKATMSESQLFRDPYRSLDLIAGPKAPRADSIDPALNIGTRNVDSFRDPFKPIARNASNDNLPHKGDPSTAPSSPPRALPAGAPSPLTHAPPISTSTEAAPPPKAVSPAGSEEKPARSQGRHAGSQRQQTDSEERHALAAAQLLGELKANIAAATNPRPGPIIDVKATNEGLLVSLTDQLNFSMFPVGSAQPQIAVVQAMQAIAKSLQNRPGAIIVRGHTDGRPYKSATYDNWRLSSARAQMAYYMLTRAGLPERRFERIEGYADRQLKDPKHPLDAKNRRIEILLLEPKP